MGLEYLPTFTNKLNPNCRLNIPVPLDPMGLEFRNVSISHINHPSLSSLATWKHNKACVPTLGISRQDLADTSGRPRLDESGETPLSPLDLFEVMFYGSYSGKSPSNHHSDPFGKFIFVLLQASWPCKIRWFPDFPLDHWKVPSRPESGHPMGVTESFEREFRPFRNRAMSSWRTPKVWGNDLIWLICFEWVETTNQIYNI